MRLIGHIMRVASLCPQLLGRIHLVFTDIRLVALRLDKSNLGDTVSLLLGLAILGLKADELSNALREGGMEESRVTKVIGEATRRMPATGEGLTKPAVGGALKRHKT